MNKMLTAMSQDMRIYPYKGETEDSFCFRLCYSALGQWCLNLASGMTNGVIGVSNAKITMTLNKMLKSYAQLFPGLQSRFGEDFTSFIKTIYDETGYLINDEKGTRIANYGRGIKLGGKTLFFGLASSNSSFEVNGLGVFAEKQAEIFAGVKDFLRRDSLSAEEYFESKFRPLEFDDKLLAGYKRSDIQFFDPNQAKYQHAWLSKMVTDCTIARVQNSLLYFATMKIGNDLYYRAEPSDDAGIGKFTSREYIRLQIAIRTHYRNSVKFTVIKLDDVYSILETRYFLPNREYYFMLLISWPMENVSCRNRFLVKNSMIEEIFPVLSGIGFKRKL
ncbi:MAG: hypothetical protein LBT59_03150 [Clostridiales bacterium]|jgi:hypothetical protein|nr:hypothetical protein [Clostridiales bacterium]